MLQGVIFTSVWGCHNCLCVVGCHSCLCVAGCHGYFCMGCHNCLCVVGCHCCLCCRVSLLLLYGVCCRVSLLLVLQGVIVTFVWGGIACVL